MIIQSTSSCVFHCASQIRRSFPDMHAIYPSLTVGHACHILAIAQCRSQDCANVDHAHVSIVILRNFTNQQQLVMSDWITSIVTQFVCLQYRNLGLTKCACRHNTIRMTDCAVEGDFHFTTAIVPNFGTKAYVGTRHLIHFLMWT